MEHQELPGPSVAGTKCNNGQEERLNGAVEKNPRNEVFAVNHSDYSEEDCSYMLRVLEKDAFSTVVSAFRAQGMLNEYKRMLLEHLKTALFISDETYRAEIRRAANDELLTKAAQTLNPSYDVYAQWGIEGQEAVPHFDDIPIRVDVDDVDAATNTSPLNVANELLRLANAHNARIRNENIELYKLIAIPKAPYVPERLRLLLRETESDYEGRIEILPTGEQDSHLRTSRAKSNSIAQEGDGMKQSVRTMDDTKESSVGDLVQRGIFHSDGASSTSVTRPFSLDLAMSCPSSSSSSTPIVTSTVQTAFISQATSQVNDDSDMKTECLRPKKRRIRQRDPSATCARVLPFRFESPAPGQKNKPIRGNPDRRPTRQISPLGISNYTPTSSLSSNPSVTGAYSTQVSTLPAYRTMPGNPAAVINSGRLHQVSSLTTSGMVVKRARTFSSAGHESTNTDGGSTYVRQLNNAQNMLRIQQPVQRAYIRSSSGQRFYASPIVSAYSNPARPYYGNPNAVVGFMRSFSNTTSSSYSISSAPSTSASHHSQPQAITSTEIQRLVAQAASSGQPQQYRTIKRTPIALASSPRLSIANQRQVPSTSAAPFLNLSDPNSGNLNHSPLRVAQRAISSSSSSSSPSSSLVTVAQRTNTAVATSVIDSSLSGHDSQSQPNSRRESEMQQCDLDTIAAVNSITQESNEMIEQERRADPDDLVIAPDERSSDDVRLECDEVLLPESCCMLSSRMNNPASVPVTQLHHRTTSEQIPMIISYRGENRGESRLVPEQYANGLIRQEEHNVINYITASQCIQ